MESPKLKHVLHTQPLDADDPILSEDDIGKVLAEAGEVTFSELKSAASFLSNDLEGRASKKDIQSLFDFCEKKYAHASDLALIANHVGGGSDQSTNISLIASQLETYAKKTRWLQWLRMWLVTLIR